MKTILLAATLLIGLLAGTAPSQAQEQQPVLVVTGLQATFSITSALARDTGILVRNLPARPTPMAAQKLMLGRSDAEALGLLDAATAVVTLGAVWPQDPLFAVARARNIRVVEIDASRPLSGGRSGVAEIAAPASIAAWRDPAPQERADGVSPFVWLSVSNGVRMAEIVAEDLIRLVPDQAETISANLGAFTDELRSIRSEFETRFAALPDPRVYALSPSFIYMTNEVGVFVEGYFLEQDIRWTEADHAGLTALLRSDDIGVVIHQWQPAAPIAAAIEAAGAQLLVLQSGDPGQPDDSGALPANGYQTLLRANLEALLQALG
jgi:ABC-type Zn uptake system ZnuABC Zn-binding protein ZnuA